MRRIGTIHFQTSFTHFEQPPPSPNPLIDLGTDRLLPPSLRRSGGIASIPPPHHHPIPSLVALRFSLQLNVMRSSCRRHCPPSWSCLRAAFPFSTTTTSTRLPYPLPRMQSLKFNFSWRRCKFCRCRLFENRAGMCHVLCAVLRMYVSRKMNTKQGCRTLFSFRTTAGPTFLRSIDDVLLWWSCFENIPLSFVSFHPSCLIPSPSFYVSPPIRCPICLSPSPPFVRHPPFLPFSWLPQWCRVCTLVVRVRLLH